METLIINKRHELPLKNRLIWDTITVFLWLGWLYLWKPFFIVIYQILILDAEPEEISDVIYDTIKSIPFDHALFMLIATPVVLFILSRIHRHNAPSTHLVFETEDYAKHFKIDLDTLSRCNSSQLITIYHDEHGQITQLENSINR